MDTPGVPVGPLEIKKVDVDKCKLSWSAPEYDGGAAITNYVLEKKETNCVKWTTVDAHFTTTSCEISKLKLYTVVFCD